MMTTHALLSRFSQLRALVIGDAMLDSYIEGEASRLCREGPVPVVYKKSELHLPGGAANTAANLRALGAEVTFLSLIGQDRAGHLLHEELRKRDVEDRYLLSSPQVSTLHKQRILADGQYVVRLDEGELAHGDEIAPEVQKRLVSALEKAYPACDLVVVSDYCYGVVCASLVERLHRLHEKHPKVLLLDSKHLEHLASLHATVVTPNYAEALRLVEEDTADEEVKQHWQGDIERLGKHILARLQSEHVAITLGAQGVFLLGRQGQPRHLPAYPVIHANDVGAGDSFASALALALAAGGQMEEAAQLGIEAACIAVTKRWTALVSLEELQHRLRAKTYTATENSKRRSLSDLRVKLEQLRQSGQKIVFTNGVFDLLHFGHIKLLRQARMLGDVLVVGINSDSSTRRLKGEGRPINSEQERMALVEALDAVDYVILFDEDTPEALIRALRPHIHVKGGNYANRALPEAAAVRESGGRIVIIPRENGKSTSGTIARITAATAHEPAKTPGPHHQLRAEVTHD